MMYRLYKYVKGWVNKRRAALKTFSGIRWIKNLKQLCDALALKKKYTDIAKNYIIKRAINFSEGKYTPKILKPFIFFFCNGLYNAVLYTLFSSVIIEVWIAKGILISFVEARHLFLKKKETTLDKLNSFIERYEPLVPRIKEKELLYGRRLGVMETHEFCEKCFAIRNTLFTQPKKRD